MTAFIRLVARLAQVDACTGFESELARAREIIEGIIVQEGAINRSPKHRRSASELLKLRDDLWEVGGIAQHAALWHCEQ